MLQQTTPRRRITAPLLASRRRARPTTVTRQIQSGAPPEHIYLMTIVWEDDGDET